MYLSGAPFLNNPITAIRGRWRGWLTRVATWQMTLAIQWFWNFAWVLFNKSGKGLLYNIIWGWLIRKAMIMTSIVPTMLSRLPSWNTYYIMISWIDHVFFSLSLPKYLKDLRLWYDTWLYCCLLKMVSNTFLLFALSPSTFQNLGNLECLQYGSFMCMYMYVCLCIYIYTLKYSTVNAYFSLTWKEMDIIIENICSPQWCFLMGCEEASHSKTL